MGLPPVPAPLSAGGFLCLGVSPNQQGGTDLRPRSPRSWVLLPSSSEEPREGFQDLATKLRILKQYHRASASASLQNIPQAEIKNASKIPARSFY